MHDLKTIRDNPDQFDAALKRRGIEAKAAEILSLDEEHRRLLTEMQAMQARRNAASKEIGQAKRKGEDATALINEVQGLKDRLATVEVDAEEVAVRLKSILESLPNVLADDVPDGADENDNVTLREWGTPRQFDFEPRQHFEIGERLGQMDFERAARLSGSRFVVLRGALARMERALAMFMLDLQTAEHGFEEVQPPFLVNSEPLYGTGQLPKFAEDLFQTTNGMWLIPTAEVPLTNLVAGEILKADELPKRVAAYTPCFRSEAGAAGRDTRGMLRQHQFGKVEMVVIAEPERSDEEHERMTRCAEEVLQRLGLAYRVVTLCSGDTGFSARKTYDLEVWLPGQNRYREISSVSNCGDFQARRMKARYRPEGAKETRFVHTLNGSGIAVGRALIAVLETYQQEDGSVIVPEVLRPYMGGIERLTPPA